MGNRPKSHLTQVLRLEASGSPNEMMKQLIILVCTGFCHKMMKFWFHKFS